MTRLLVHVEGQTEERFVNDVLRDHLLSTGYYSVSARIVGNARQKQGRGGIKPWPAVKKDILNHLREDPACIATTMVDYYALPSSWPRRLELRAKARKAESVESAILKEVSEEMGPKFNQQRFVPFVVMHEFEGLLFSDCAAFSRAIGQSRLEAKFQNIRDQFTTPEDINDSSITAPSKRILKLIPGYEKPLQGVLAALEIGLTRIRQECPHFDNWVNRLEGQAAA